MLLFFLVEVNVSTILQHLPQLIEQKNDATLEELVIQLEEKIGVRVSRATMGRVVVKLKMTRKKTLHATERQSERVQQLRVQYWQATFWERVLSPKSWRVKLGK